MRFVWVVVFLFLLVPTLSTALTNTEYNRANFFTATEARPEMTIPIAPSGQQFRKVTVEYDLEIPDLNSNSISGPFEYMVMDLKATTGTGGWVKFLLGMDARKSQGGWQVYFDGLGNPGPDTGSAAWTSGNYHIIMVLDGDAAQGRITITKGGQPFYSGTTGDLTQGHVTSGLIFDANALDRGLALVLGVDEDMEGGYHRRPLGFRYSNLRVEAIEGMPTVGGGAPPEVLAQDAGPYIASSGVTKTLTAPVAGTYTIEADVTPSQNRWRTDITPGTDDHGQPWGIVYPLIGVEGHAYGNNPSSGCVKNCLAYLNAFNSQGSKALYIYRSALGGNDGFEEQHQSFEWIPGTRYHLTVLIDSVNQKQTMTITGGEAFSKTEDLPPEISTAVSQGITVFFGGDKDWDGERVARPNGWKFENMKITGGSGSGSGGGCTDCQCIDLGAVENPAAVGPLKKLASNPVFFDDGTGKAVYLTGSHTWQNFQDYGTTADFNYDAYLDMMEANNQNFMRLWVWEQPSNEDDGTRWAPLPWQKTANGKYDLTQFNQEYFTRLRTRVQQANDRGIYVQVMLFEYYIDVRDHPLVAGNNINDVRATVTSNSNGDNVHHMGVGQSALQAQERYVRKTIDTLNDLDNVLWEICNECLSATTTWQAHMVDVIHEYEATKPKQHLVGVNTGYGNGGENFNGLKATGADIVAIPLKDGSSYNPPQSDGSVIVLADTDHIQSILFSTSASTRVDWAWKSITRGLHPMSMDTIQVAFPSDWCREGPSCRPDTAFHKAARRAMGQTAAFANRPDLAQLRPQRTKCSTQYCLIGSGGGIVYAPEGGTFTVDLTGATGTFATQWINPMTGELRAGESVQGGASRSFTAPFSGMAALSIATQALTLPVSATACFAGSGTGPGSGSGSGSGDAGSATPYAQSVVDGSGFAPSEPDPASTVLLLDAAFVASLGTARTVVVPTTTLYEKITVSFDLVIPAGVSADRFYPIIEVRNNCSSKLITAFTVRTPGSHDSGQAILDARGLARRITGTVPYAPGTYRVSMVLDIADSEAYEVITQGGTVVQTAGGSLNADAANVIRVGQTAGGLRLIFGGAVSNGNQLIAAPTGWEARDLTIEIVPTNAESGDTGPDGADLETDEGRLAFLAATLADAAREEGGDWTVDCGPAGEVLPMAPSDAPDDAGQDYCTLDADGDIIFGTFGVAGDEPSESLILTSLQDASYRLHITPEDIDPNACDNIDTTVMEFQECDDAIDGLRVYAFVHPVSASTFLIISDSGIDAFSTSVLERIGAFFSGLFGFDEETATSAAGIPMRRVHHAFLAHDQGRDIVATWLDDEATLLYRGFVTDLSAWLPKDALYTPGLGAQVLIAPLEENAPRDVRAWRSITSGLRVQDVAGTAIGSGSCGDGVIGFGEQCEPSLTVPTCGSLTGEDEDVRPITCGAPASENECRFDVAACGIGSGCADDWTPIPRPLPCGTSRVRDEGDDPACPNDATGGNGNDGGDDDDGDDEPPGPTVPVCPTTTETVATRGPYDLRLRYAADGTPQLQVAHLRFMNHVCDGTNDPVNSELGRATLNTAWIPHNPGTSTTLFIREKGDEDGHNDVRIIAQATATGWHITGSPENLATNNHVGPGHECWSCGSSSDVYCEQLSIDVPVIECGVQPEESSTEPECLAYGETCEIAADCCSARCRDEGGVMQCTVRVGGSPDPELI